jgi:hypothetical protein
MGMDQVGLVADPLRIPAMGGDAPVNRLGEVGGDEEPLPGLGPGHGMQQTKIDADKTEVVAGIWIRIL